VFVAASSRCFADLPLSAALMQLVDLEYSAVEIMVHEHGGHLKPSEVLADVDHDLRTATRRNHSATHLLHYALRKVLGAHAQQKGSLVGPDRLRFDFTHGKPLDSDELRRIEDLVNAKILVNAPIETQVLPIEEARKSGAMAIFEEKY